MKTLYEHPFWWNNGPRRQYYCDAIGAVQTSNPQNDRNLTRVLEEDLEGLETSLTQARLELMETKTVGRELLQRVQVRHLPIT